jgi:hypothetical protein
VLFYSFKDRTIKLVGQQTKPLKDHINILDLQRLSIGRMNLPFEAEIGKLTPQQSIIDPYDLVGIV